ncbi:hypothetical protein CM15mP35_01010 [bacterium]|nr:MAG: hypothetical protein CM15mP35_01010 [bacterium]
MARFILLSSLRKQCNFWIRLQRSSPVFNLAYDSQNMFRVGHDKSNEHVHNYLINIFGRGV